MSKFYIYTIRSLPNILWPLKKIITKFALRKCGKNVKIGPNVFILNPNLVTMGNNVFIGDKSTLAGNVEINIDDHVMFGPEVMIRGGDHNMSVVGKPMRFVHEGGKNIPVKIEKDVWVGARATVLKGVTIGEGSVIGAASVVTKNIIPYSINVGNPAKPIKCRFSKSELKEHLIMIDSKYSIEEINEMYKLNGIILND
jgi:acetyltransferase-like isoleucine patch superfamily enzyme